MELRQLEYVVGVVDEGSFTRAARALHVAQPSLSQGVARLEAELGVPLFLRLGRRVALTPAGEAFVGSARHVLRDVAVLGASVQAVTGLEAGRLDLVSLPTLAADPLAPIIGAFRRAHPGVAVRVTEPEGADAVIARVRDGRAEVGLAELPVGAVDIVATPLLDQELVAILGPGKPRDELRVEELANLPLLTSPAGTSTRRLLTEAFAVADVEPRVAVETEQREAIVPLVVAGAGVAVVPRGVARAAERQGATVARLRPSLHRTIGIVVRAAPLSPAAWQFRALALELAGREARDT
jgi:LysR family carnitine catabolism transcriptional activator